MPSRWWWLRVRGLMKRMRLAWFVGAALAVGCVAIATGAEPVTVTGLVYEDTNGNGRRDGGEPGVAGVPVTEGVGFTETDKDGRFRLVLQADPVKRHGEAHVVALSVPRGYAAAGPWFALVGGAGDGDLEFALRRSDVALPFTWIHGTDCHVPRAGEEHFIGFRREVLARKQEVEFCVLTGDLVDLSDAHPPEQGLAEFKFLEEQTRDFPVPLRCIPGNHDIAGVNALDKGWSPETDGYAYHLYTRIVGPLRWSFNVADIHFVGLDFNSWSGTKWEWGVPPSAVAWLAEDLRHAPAGSRVCLFVHHTGRSKALEAFLKEHPVDWIFMGHGHHAATSDWLGIPVFESGSITQVAKKAPQAPGYRVVKMREDGLDSEYVETGATAEGVVTPAKR